MQGRTLYQICTQDKTELVQVWGWIRDLAHQLELYYKRQKGQAYGYLNPYAVIVTADGKITLLDPGDSGNTELLRKMQQKKYRTHFVPPEQSLSQIKSQENDLYAFGRTIQFVISRLNLGRKLSKKEEKLLQKIIQGCVQGRYKDETGLREIQHLLRNMTPELKEGKEPSKKRKKGGKKSGMIVGLVAILLLLFAAGGMFYVKILPEVAQREDGPKQIVTKTQEEQNKQREGESGQVTDRRGSEEMILDEDSFWPMELGLIYLYGLGDTENSLELLKVASDQSTAGAFYFELIRSLYKSEGTMSEERMNEAFEKLADLGSKEWLEGKEYWLCMPFIEGYSRLDSENAWEKILNTSKWILERKSWPKGQNDAEYESELRQYYGIALERKELYQEAAEELLSVLELKKETQGKEEIYLRLMEIYRKMEDAEKLWKLGETAVEELPGSEALWTAYARSYLEQTELSKERRCEVATKAIQMIPELKENEQFRQILVENGAEVKGDKVCIIE